MSGGSLTLGGSSCRLDSLLALLDLIHALGHDRHHLDRILADVLDHLVEHIEALDAVLDNGVVLTVGA